jgi:DNA-binding response OmpR family regulator
MNSGRRQSLRILLAGMEPALSGAIEAALKDHGHLVDEEYSIDRVLRTLRRNPYDVVVVAGYSRYLNAVELVRQMGQEGREPGTPASLVLVPSLNKVDRYRFGSVGADHIIALEGESLLGVLAKGLGAAMQAHLQAPKALAVNADG